MAAGKNTIRQPQEVNTATMSAIRPGAPVVQLSPQEDAALSEIARNQGVNNAEAMRRIVEHLPPSGPQKQTVTDQTMNLLGKARELNLTNDDKGDPINQVMRYGFYKDLKKDMKRGDDDRMSMREMMEMVILQRMLPPDNAQGGNALNQQIINDLKAENEKNRQFYEEKFKEQAEQIRNMVFEKRIQTMEDTHAESVTSLSNQLADISSRMELYRNIPPNPSPEEKKDAISHLEDLGGQMERIKKALAPFGINPSPTSPLLPGVPVQDPYKKQDGSMDYFRYTMDKLENTIGKVSEAWQKKTPDRKQVVETPAPAETRQTEATYRQLSPEEYADTLLNKPNPTQEEQQWLNNYTDYLEKQRAKLQPRTKVPQAGPQGCRNCGNPEIYQEGFCQSCWTNQAGTPDQQAEQPKKGMLERLKEQEDLELKRTQGLM